MRRPLGIPLVFLGLSIGPSCERMPSGPKVAGPPLAADRALAINATVRSIPIEVGCWALDTPHGRYIPTGLPAAYQVDGLAVRVVFHGAPEVISLCMMGPLVSVDSIRRR